MKLNLIFLFFLIGLLGCNKGAFKSVVSEESSVDVLDDQQPPGVTRLPTVTWTTNPDVNSSITYSSNKILTFNAEPTGEVQVTCWKRLVGTVNEVSFNCSNANSLVADAEGNFEYIVKAQLGKNTARTTAKRISIDRTSPVLSFASEPTLLSTGNQFRFTLNISENLAYMVVKLDGNIIVPLGTALAYDVTINDFNVHTAEFVAYDMAGNSSNTVNRSVQRVQPENRFNNLTRGSLLNRTNDDSSGQPGNGSSLTWDGKFMIRTTGLGWEASALRPNRVAVGSGLTHDVNLQSAFSPSILILSRKPLPSNVNYGMGAYNAELLVKGLYRTILNREPDPGGFENYLNLLNSGTVDPEDIKTGFYQSPEYQNLIAQNPAHANHQRFFAKSKFTEFNALALAPYYTDRAFIKDLYQNILPSTAFTEADIQYWVNYLKTNSRQAAINYFSTRPGADTSKLPHSYKNFGRLSTQENPYSSNIKGEYESSGQFKTYDVLLYTQVYKLFEYTPVYPHGRHPDLEYLPPDAIGVMRVRFVISNPNTDSADLAGYYILDDYAPISANGAYIIGIEPTVTSDGLLMVFNENRTQGVLKYLYTEDPVAKNQWTYPQHLTAMHTQKNNLIHGIKFGERFPLAKKPIYDSKGNQYADQEGIKGAYPWISWEGSEVYFTSLVSKHVTPAVDARRAGSSVVGQWTGNAVRLLDGYLNKGLLAYEKLVLFTGGIGSTSSFWNPFKDSLNPRLPFLFERPTVMLMGFNDNSYNDVSFKEFVDGQYIVAWPMGEALNKINATSDSYNSLIDFSRTPDLSGLFNTGVLNSGASFQSALMERGYSDTYIGYKGQAIRFTNSGAVTLNYNSSFNRLNSFTVEAFVKPLVAQNFKIAQIVSGASAPIALQIVSGQLQASIAAGSVANINSGAETIPTNVWSHVAFSYNHRSGILKLYINGKMVNQVVLSNLLPALNVTNHQLVVGPAQSDATSHFIVHIDEFRLSSTVRSSVEIADAAHLPYSERFNFQFTLPPRIAAKDLRIPDEENISFRKAQLGAILFSDVRLSANNSVSCATCHSVSANLSDVRQFSQGFAGNTLTRHSPISFNRALSSLQMWDGKFNSLHAQAEGPLTNPAEMGMTVSTLVAKVNSISSYRQAFQNAYSQQPNIDNIQAAISAFLSVMMTQNNSLADQFEISGAGLNSQQIRGRNLFFGQARCSACHSGPNYTDEQMHSVGFFVGSADEGKKAVTLRNDDLRLFKTPTLRNISQTAPYMHDGRFSNLAQVITLYNMGSLSDPTRSSEIKPLNLSATDVVDLEEYLKTLNSSVVPLFNINLNLTIEQYNP